MIALEQSSGVPDAVALFYVSSEHPGYFTNAILSGQFTDTDARSRVVRYFFYDHMIIGTNRNRRKVGNADDLAVLRQVVQVRGDRQGDFSSDSRIDFVKH